MSIEVAKSVIEAPETIDNAIIETIYPMAQVRLWVDKLMDVFNFGFKEGTTAYTLLSLGIVVGFVVIVWMLLKLFFVRALPKLLSKIKMLEKAGQTNIKIANKLITIIAVSLFSGLLPVVWPVDTIWSKLLSVICSVWVTWMVAQLIAFILEALRTYMLSTTKYMNSPFVNLFLVIRGLVYFIAVLVIISILFNLDMTSIGAALTALSAVLMLVFKDTILGFVASIQLSSNDMVRVGDWISMPKHGADGDVIDISLATIKVRNFDRTVTTIPPYSMVSDSFTNWRPMQESGGRRVKRSIYIDMQSIKYADDALLEKVKNSPELKDYIETAVEEISKENHQKGVENSYSKRRLTNIGIFRRYIVEYLRNHPGVNLDFTCMVRQQQPTAQGLPLELYFFTNTVVWVEYESIQSDIFDHLLAVTSVFDLHVFQDINGNNINSLVTDSNISTFVADINTDEDPKELLEGARKQTDTEE